MKAANLVGANQIGAVPYPREGEAHGTILVTLVSNVLVHGVTGRVIVKRSYSDDATRERIIDEPDANLANITVMFEREGYAPDAGDSFWAMYMPTGMVGMMEVTASPAGSKCARAATPSPPTATTRSSINEGILGRSAGTHSRLRSQQKPLGNRRLFSRLYKCRDRRHLYKPALMNFDRWNSAQEKRDGQAVPFQIIAVNDDYLRVAQAYMLISMPTQTSAIFGVFQAMIFILF